MVRLIALSRKSRAATLGVSDRSTGDKRATLAAAPAASEKTDELKSIGLEEKRAEERTEHAHQPTFERMQRLDGYVVETLDAPQAQQAREILQDDHLVVPDIYLELPRAMLADERVRTRPRGFSWPAPSRVTEAHANGATGQGVIVGVIDTGVDAGHLELRRKRIDYRYVPLDPLNSPVRPVHGFDVDGHGTHVCGIIAGERFGVAPDVDLMVASVIESETIRTSLVRIVLALDWMLQELTADANLDRPAIVNMSLGFRAEWISPQDQQEVLAALRDLLDTLLVDFDVLPVVAIGNDGQGIARLPGTFGNVLSVGAVDEQLTPAWFTGSSAAGEPAEPDIAGFGVDVLSSLERDVDGWSWYARMSGTSMATPYVVGIAALAASANPALKGAALRQHLLNTALPIAPTDIRNGAGLARM